MLRHYSTYIKCSLHQSVQTAFILHFVILYYCNTNTAVNSGKISKPRSWSSWHYRVISSGCFLLFGYGKPVAKDKMGCCLRYLFNKRFSFDKAYCEMSQPAFSINCYGKHFLFLAVSRWNLKSQHLCYQRISPSFVFGCNVFLFFIWKNVKSIKYVVDAELQLMTDHMCLNK